MRANHPKNARTQLSRGKTFGKMETDSKELFFFKIMTRNKVDRETNGIKKKKKIAPQESIDILLVIYKKNDLWCA